MGFNLLSHYNLVHKFILVPQALKILEAKAAVDKEWEKLEKMPPRPLTKVRSKKEVIQEAQNRWKNSFILLHSWTLVIFKSQSWRQKFKKIYKTRVVLRGDTEDDSGSYAEMAAKGMDVLARPPGAGQLADAMSSYTQVKVEDSPVPLKFRKSRMSAHLDTSTTNQVAQILVQYGRPSRSS